MTSEFLSTPNILNAKCNADVPEFSATANLVPQKLEILFSKILIFLKKSKHIDFLEFY